VKPIDKSIKKYSQQNDRREKIKTDPEVGQEMEVSAANVNLHYLLFTGHMLDKPERDSPRFPAKKENAVRQKMKDVIEKIINNTSGRLKGIAGGACGGDILFHELCRELDIASELFLALPREKFLTESVAFAGPGWVKRFDKLFKKLPVHIFSEDKTFSGWQKGKKALSIWEKNNLWLLNTTLACGGENMTLLALWDGKGGDGPGGTADMVKEAKAKGARIIIIHPEEC